MDVIDQAFSDMYFEYVVTVCLCKGTPYETTYIAEYDQNLEHCKAYARRQRLIYGEDRIRLRKVTFEDAEEHDHFTQRAYRDIEKLEDYASDHGVDESGGYF